MKIAIIGDVHGFWNEFDVEYFNQSDYDFILFTGDLRSYTEKESVVAERISFLEKQAFVIPGNTDTSNSFQAAGEIFRNQFLIQNFFLGQESRLDKMKAALGKLRLVGYEVHTLSKEKSIDLIVLRPFAMGKELSYAPILKKRYGIRSMEDSKERIKTLIDSSLEENLLFLGHNGPKGLGEKETSLWSSDFTETPIDWGDEDYLFGIEYAKSRGKRVLAAIAGHMHHRLKKRNILRNWREEKEGTYFINAARVPRIFKIDSNTVHHHIRLEINKGDVSAREMLIHP
ncbi:MAG TPA: metallophosphoesterase [Leptospiraceae bacterium]|nr:metallophosphoesterase [Leptospiraceae bacterium]HMW04298.1 metallophosphoesterase [Leptospiraceae bacterium]HMX30644.1 metallophosphoesterase [Leptospiraceae bacterium]HMY31344.1 metallophosphoesterase [Leptospiraceae bacterium]HMZ63619.1 metallophosphoesterase [Leptospiraceae bacterium]